MKILGFFYLNNLRNNLKIRISYAQVSGNSGFYSLYRDRLVWYMTFVLRTEDRIRFQGFKSLSLRYQLTLNTLFHQPPS